MNQVYIKYYDDQKKLSSLKFEAKEDQKFYEKYDLIHFGIACGKEIAEKDKRYILWRDKYNLIRSRFRDYLPSLKRKRGNGLSCASYKGFDHTRTS